MSSSSVERASVDAGVSGAGRRWAIASWLTLYYTISIFVLLAAASGFLYWDLQRSLDQQSHDYVRQKMQVLTRILQQRPLDRAGVEQEVLEEAEISRRSQAPFLLRVLDQDNRLFVETPGMAALVPMSVFPPTTGGAAQERRWRAADRSSFLLASSSVPADAAQQRFQVQVALNVSSADAVLARYRRDIAVVLATGLLLAATIGGWITRRGLAPIAAITRATERIGVQQLHDRIETGPWPKELVSLASAYDRMLDRLQEAFDRLSQFSADLAHELRTPINNLMGETQVALSRDRTAGDYARVLQSALEEHARLARMIDSMLFLAQADQARSALMPAPLDAREQLQAVADFYQALADEQGVALICKGQGRVSADPLLLRRALSNLLSNALKYTPRGRRVTLCAHEGAGGMQKLSVIDSGIGIAAEHLPKLGDRFYRVDPSRADGERGAGLGLAIVKSIMALHGGRLVIESTAGYGTTVSLVFAAGPARAIETA